MLIIIARINSHAMLEAKLFLNRSLSLSSFSLIFLSTCICSVSRGFAVRCNSILSFFGCNKNTYYSASEPN